MSERGLYPATENWQKALGDFLIYITADITYEPATRWRGGRLSANITINALDYYDFNKGALDVMTGLPDDTNGRFAVLGWAHSFITTGSFTKRNVRWSLNECE